MLDIYQLGSVHGIDLYGPNDIFMGYSWSKTIGDDYMKILREVPHIEDISELKFDESFMNALYVRCKESDFPEKTKINMVGIYNIYMSFMGNVKEYIKKVDYLNYTSGPTQIDTVAGIIPIGNTQ